MGYSPVCTREWDPIYCDKPRVKCGDCPNRNFAPMTDDVIRQHLEGNHTIGIYPLLPEETCYLLALDFDKQSWMEDAAVFMETCNRMDVPAALERSRSGNGAHILVFFSEAVSASSARKLGCYYAYAIANPKCHAYPNAYSNDNTIAYRNCHAFRNAHANANTYAF